MIRDQFLLIMAITICIKKFKYKISMCKGLDEEVGRRIWTRRGKDR